MVQVTFTIKLIKEQSVCAHFNEVEVGSQYSCYCNLNDAFLSPDQENSIKLREKNLQLNQEIHTKHQECCNLKEKFSTLSSENMTLTRQLARTTQENRRLSKQVRVQGSLDVLLSWCFVSRFKMMMMMMKVCERDDLTTYCIWWLIRFCILENSSLFWRINSKKNLGV